MLALLIACTPSPARFLERGFEIQCEQWEACDPDGFAEHYDDVDACFDGEWELSGSYLSEFEEEGCSYDGSRAADCLHDLEQIDCAVWNDDTTAPESCYYVWTCPE